jgi:hypothetical protein
VRQRAEVQELLWKEYVVSHAKRARMRANRSRRKLAALKQVPLPPAIQARRAAGNQAAKEKQWGWAGYRVTHYRNTEQGSAR